MKGGTVMKNQKGFTLIEIVVTVVILAVLMAVAVPISLSFMDDIHEQRILNEAQAVYNVAKSNSRSNKVSLQGSYIDSSGTYYEIDTSIMSSYVSKAKGTGVIKELRYENGEIVLFRYKYDETTYVRYTKDTGIFEIETNPDIQTIAEIIMTSEIPSQKIHNYFNSRPADTAINSTIDSEAPSKEESNNELNGIGNEIYNWLNESGINSNYFSWKVIFEKKETDANKCEHGKRYVYAMYICEKKINASMEGQKLDVKVYKFYADGCQYNLDKSFGTTIQSEVVIKDWKGYKFPVLKIGDVI